MDYAQIYDVFINRIKAQKRVKTNGVYYESHHIVPQSMGGAHGPHNRVWLTAREHFFAHHLLWRIHRTPGMALAFFMMSNGNQLQQREKKISSREYAKIRETVMIATKENGKKAYAVKAGFHALSKDENRKNAAISGRINLENGTGVFGQTEEQRIANASKAGRVTASRHGLTGVCLNPNNPEWVEARRASGKSAAARMSKEDRLAASRVGNAVLAEKQKGCRWITDGTTRKRLFAGETLPDGWRFGLK